MFHKAIHDANQHAKHVDLNVKVPPKASIMEIRYQEINLRLNM
jgi:hypothetical protein